MADDDWKSVGDHIDVDRMLRLISNQFHIRQNCLMLMNWICQGMNIFSFIFLGFIPDYQCRPYTNNSDDKWPTDLHQMMQSNESNVTLEYGECHVTVLTNGQPLTNQTFPCPNGYLYSRSVELSFITEWDLVCDKEALGVLSQTLLTVGMVIGASLIPNFADKYGRKPVLIICMFGIWTSSLALGFSPSHDVFMVLRFLIGFFQQGLCIPNMTLSLELFPTEHRAFINMLCGSGWCLGCFLLTPLAYYLQNHRWRTLAIAISCSGAMVLLDILFLEESLRWLFAKNRLSHAKQIVRRAAKINGVDFNEIWQKCVTKSSIELETMSDKNHPTTSSPSRLSQTKQQLVDENNERKLSLTPSPLSLLTTIGNPDDNKNDRIVSENRIFANLPPVKKASMCFKPKDTDSALNLLTNDILRFIMSIQIFTWFITALTYYGLYLTSSSLAGDRFFNFFLTVLMEFLSSMFTWKTFVWIGRKKTLVMFLSIAVVSLLTATGINISFDKKSKYSIISTVASMVGMFGISGSFNGVWGYLPELIPTKYRNAALGIASSAARIGSALSPFSAFLIRYIAWGPGVIFSAGSLLANLLIMMLPETRGRQLPQNIDDVTTWMKKPLKKPVKDSTNYSDSTRKRRVIPLCLPSID